MNGALTIGTLDGANVEIRDAVGANNFFLFGLSAQEVADGTARGYHPGDVLAKDPELSQLLHWILQGQFSPGEPGLFEPIVRTLIEKDPYFVLADFRSYVACQGDVAREWLDRDAWTEEGPSSTCPAWDRSAQTDRSGSTPRRIWKTTPVRVALRGA